LVLVAVTETHRGIELVWRIESARLIAGLARIMRDIGLAVSNIGKSIVRGRNLGPGFPAQIVLRTKEV
jgi:predicted RNA polymerase sigma factor